MTTSFEDILATGNSRLLPFWHAVLKLISTPEHGYEEQRKRLMSCFISATSVPTLAVFAVFHFIRGEMVEGLIEAILTLGLCYSLFALRRAASGRGIFTANIAGVGLLFVYLLIVGGDHGSKLLWMYVFPLVAFFLLGKRDGFYWTLGIAAVFSVILFFPPPSIAVFPYPTAVKVRFMVTFAFVTTMTLIFESVRQHFQRGMEQKHLDLVEEKRKLSEANRLIRSISIKDPLTGAYNRLYLDQRLPQELKRARRYGHAVSVVLCDLDFFKAVNDRYGHQAGDRVLTHVVDTITAGLRSGIDWVARYGGEEFVVVLPETGLTQARKVAERLRTSIAATPVQLPEAGIVVTASFGVSAFESTAVESEVISEALLRIADQNLYRAKQLGRNCVQAD